MKLLTFISVTVVFFAVLFHSCEGKEKDKDKETEIITKDLSGAVQKGPYLNGTLVSVSELREDLSQTGKVYTTEISDNKGSFSLQNLSLISQYVEITANGYYFNEIEGKNSVAPLTLSAISDINDKNSLNVNVLTYLEKSRVKYLVTSGMTFPLAKKQAQAEILSLFEISKPAIASSELLDITKGGDDNAVLLSISSILQGNRTVSELSELLSNISTDLKEDGELNSPALGTSLINGAHFLDAVAIRDNLIEKYDGLGSVANIPDFHDLLDQFIRNTDFLFTYVISYPENGATGPNLLLPGRTSYVSTPINGTEGYQNSLTAFAPGQTDISVRLSILDTCEPETPICDTCVLPYCDTCVSPCLPCGQSENCSWAMDPTLSGWSVSFESYVPAIFRYSKDFSKETPDLKVALYGHGKALIEIFENKSTTATRSKTIRW